MSLEGMGPSLGVEGSTNHELFEIYVERVLAPTLCRGQVVVMDNLSAHKGERVRELIEPQGSKLLYLPVYSPDFNPIEEAFSKIKAFIRKAEARSREALIEAMGATISAVTARDARGFLALRVRYTGSNGMRRPRLCSARSLQSRAVLGRPQGTRYLTIG